MSESSIYATRADIPEKYKWDLAAMYVDDSAWEADFARVGALLEALSAYEGELRSSPTNLLGALVAHERASRLTDKLWQYTARHRDEDMSDSHYQALFERANGLRTDLDAAAAYLRPELLALEPGVLDTFMIQESALQAYGHYFDSILREKAHLLSSREEALLAQASLMSDSPRIIHAMLTDADLPFDTVADETGVAVPISRTRYERFIRGADRRLRKDASDAFFSQYIAHRNTLAATFAAHVKKTVFFARARHFPSALEAALFPDNIPPSVYSSLIEGVRERIPLLQRYLKIRKQALRLDELHIYDMVNSLIDEEGRGRTYDEAVETVLAALDPLGPDYVRALGEGFRARWVDAFESPNKRANAHSSGCYDTYPYTMLNYLEQLQGAYTMAHEMGHAMHSFYAYKTQPYYYAYYSDFVSEVASILNETLLSHYLLENATDRETKLLVVNMQLNLIRHTLFRQTMLAEFEKAAYDAVERGEALTADWLCDTYYHLVLQYHGDALAHDDFLRIEWAYLPHFYSSFYVYQYATGVAAALSLSTAILREGVPAAERYRRFLSRGGSAYPIDLLKEAGVDMTTPAPVRDALAIFTQRLDALEELLGN